MELELEWHRGRAEVSPRDSRAQAGAPRLVKTIVARTYMDLHKLNITKQLLIFIIEVSLGQPSALLVAILLGANTLKPWLNTAD